jgi:hypothetical protein
MHRASLPGRLTLAGRLLAARDYPMPALGRLGRDGTALFSSFC